MTGFVVQGHIWYDPSVLRDSYMNKPLFEWAWYIEEDVLCFVRAVCAVSVVSISLEQFSISMNIMTMGRGALRVASNDIWTSSPLLPAQQQKL